MKKIIMLAVVCLIFNCWVTPHQVFDFLGTPVAPQEIFGFWGTPVAGAMDMAGDTQSSHGAHMEGGCNMGHTAADSPMLYNPAFGDQVYHVHPAGMWMVDYRFMHTSLNGLRTGTANVDSNSAASSPYNYMMIPTSMTMDMHMFMVMYGITDRLTVMGMANYQFNEMKMLMNMGMGMGNVSSPPMSTSGFGDTEVRGIYKINGWLTGSLGLSMPTGSIKQITDSATTRNGIGVGRLCTPIT